MSDYNAVVLLGPTAAGKTSLGVAIAAHYGWDIISADSRQVYKGLDLGSGKDIAEYQIEQTLSDGTVCKRNIPYHLIDIVTLDEEYNVYRFQKDFYDIFDDMTQRGTMPFVVGGTGMYIDSVVRSYNLVSVPENPELRAELESKDIDELATMLRKLKPDTHTTTNFTIKERAVHAIESALFLASDEYKRRKAELDNARQIRPFVIGTTLERSLLRKNIEIRLKQRFDAGMIDEVRNLHEAGIAWSRLETLGLEYRWISLYLEGKVSSFDELFDGLKHAIFQFAKRQDTWFRGMEKKGVTIHWLPSIPNKQAKYDDALELIDSNIMI